MIVSLVVSLLLFLSVLPCFDFFFCGSFAVWFLSSQLVCLVCAFVVVFLLSSDCCMCWFVYCFFFVGFLPSMAGLSISNDQDSSKFNSFCPCAPSLLLSFSPSLVSHSALTFI